MYSVGGGVSASPRFRKEDELLRSSFKFQAYRPLLKLMAALGLYYPQFQNSRYHSVPQLFSSAFVVLWILRAFVRARLRVGSPDYWAAFFLVLQAIGSLWILFQLASKQTLLHRALQNSHSMDSLVESRSELEHHSRRLYRSVLIFIIVGWTLDVLCVADSVDTLNGYLVMNGLEKFLKKRGGLLKDFSLPVLVACSLDLLLTRLLISGPTLCAVSLFSVMVKGMRQKFQVFNRFFSACGQQGGGNTGVLLTTRSLREWRIARCDLRDILQELDDLWSPAVFIWIILYVLGVCVECMRLISGDPSRSELGHGLTFLYNLILSIVTFYRMVIPAVKMEETANEALIIYQEAIFSDKLSGREIANGTGGGPNTLTLLKNYVIANVGSGSGTDKESRRIKGQMESKSREATDLAHSMQISSLASVQNYMMSKGMSCEFYQQAEAMMKQLTSPPMCLTVWRYYDLTRTIALQASTAMFTYMVLLLDFNPDVKARLQGL